MSRFIQGGLSKKAPKEKGKPRELPKAGSYTSKELSATKGINSQAGGVK